MKPLEPDSKWCDIVMGSGSVSNYKLGAFNNVILKL